MDPVSCRESFARAQSFFQGYFPEFAAVAVRLPQGTEVRIFSLPYFLAAKMDAHAGRGGNDPRLSQDLEDVISVLGARTDLAAQAEGLQGDLLAHLSAAFKVLLADPGRDEALSAALESRSPAPQRKARVLAFFRQVAGVVA